jgi:HAD superfamily hydrolase (TIGR01509 family)
LKEHILDYPGVLFDLDGTLADSMHVWDYICRDWLLAQGKAPESDLEGDLEVMTLTQGAEYVIHRYGIALGPGEIITQWEAMVLDLYRNSIALKPRTADLVRSLHGAGAKLGMVTSCFPAACESFLERWELQGYFSTLVYTGEVPGDKSLPGIWLAAAERLGVAPGECVVFEDMYKALRGVRAAGMDFAAVHDPSCKDWDALKAGADWVIE